MGYGFRIGKVRGSEKETKAFEYQQTEFLLIRLGNISALKVFGEGYIPVSDYKIQSSADGETELCITIKGKIGRAHV